MEPASEYLNAELLKRETHGWERVRSTAHFVLGSMFAGTIPPRRDLVVYRRDTRAEVLRYPASVGVEDIRLDDMLNLLKVSTLSEFLSDWQLSDLDPDR